MSEIVNEYFRIVDAYAELEGIGPDAAESRLEAEVVKLFDAPQTIRGQLAMDTDSLL